MASASEYEKETVARLSEQIRLFANRVPGDVINGSIQQTRQWLKARDSALKLTRNPGVTSAQLMGALNTLKGKDEQVQRNDR
jgi:hypothetical protein